MISLTRGYLATCFLLALASAACSPKRAAQPKQDTPATPAAKPAVAAPQALHRLRILTWNLEWFPGKSPTPSADAERAQLEGASAALADLKPDVILLQEIRDWQSADALCKAVPGLEVLVVSRFQPRPQNQVVASRLAADSAWSDSWKADAATPPRGYAFAALELPGPKYLLAYSLHLKSNLNDLSQDIAMRHASARQLLRHVEEMLALYSRRGPTAVVVAGDMNTSLDDPKFTADKTLSALMEAGFHWTHKSVPFEERTTIPANNRFPDNCFDHIFTLGLGKPAARVFAHPGVSDHNAVILDVELVRADFRPQFKASAGINLLGKAGAEAAKRSANPVALQAQQTEALSAAVGTPVIVSGRVSKIGSTNNKSIHFINFENVPRGGFVAIVRQEHYAAVSSGLGGELQDILPGKDVEIQGDISIFKDAPQVVIKTPSQIRVGR